MLRRSSKVSLRGDSARDSFSSYLLKRSGGHEGHTTLRKKFQERPGGALAVDRPARAVSAALRPIGCGIILSSPGRAPLEPPVPAAATARGVAAAAECSEDAVE